MSVEPSWVMLGAVILGGLFGLLQIPAWQGSVLAGIILGRVLTTWGQSLATQWADRLFVMVNFALQGGLTSGDPGAVFTRVRGAPSPIATGSGKLGFMLALFSFPVFFMYLFGRWRFRGRSTAFGPFSIYSMSCLWRLMTCGLGGINGYLIARFLLPLLFPQAEPAIKAFGGQVASTLDESLVPVLIGFILLVIYGLQLSGRSRG